MASINHGKEIRPLSLAERNAIRDALKHYIADKGNTKAWSQKIILEEMLYGLMWANLKPETSDGR